MNSPLSSNCCIFSAMNLKPVSTSNSAAPKSLQIARAISVVTIDFTTAAFSGSFPSAFFWDRM
ncbi:MAG: hypothetical protein BWY81_00462 [Firmicutes bacterium ADurb.Bin467]|nr:MAG: hypothetical protein BWY81_00462 [Firmicutes bacterium ADurb.Bin467]